MKNRLKKAEQSIEHAPMFIGWVTGIAGKAIVTEHLFHGDLARTSALVGDVLYEVGIACHGGLSFVIAQRYEKIRKPRLLPELRNLSVLISFLLF